MGCSISKTKSFRVQHHCKSSDPNRTIEEKIILKSRSIKILLQIAEESQSESGKFNVNKEIVHNINKCLTEIVLLAELSTNLGGKALNEYLACCTAIKFHFPVHDETFHKIFERARMRIEDKTESSAIPTILRLSEINKVLLESQRGLKISTRTANSTVVIQSPASEVQVKSSKLKRLFIVGNKLSTSPHSDSQKSKCSQRSMDFGFFDEYDSPCDRRCSTLWEWVSWCKRLLNAVHTLPYLFISTSKWILGVI